MKRLFATLLVLTMLLSLVACGNKASGDTPADGGAVTEDTPTATDDGTATGDTSVASDPTEIVLWSCRTDEEGEAFQRYVDDFNASQSEYKVSMGHIDGSSAMLDIFQYSPAGDRPDLVEVSLEQQVPLLTDNPECIIPVQSFVEEDGYDVSNIPAHIVNALTDNEGNLVGTPIDNSAFGFFYNAKLLEAAGINVKTDLNSIEDIAIACDKLQANGVKYPIFIAPNALSYYSVLAAQGLHMVDMNNGNDGVCTTSLINEDPLKSATIKYFTTIQEIAEKGQNAPTDLSGSDLCQRFVEGDLAMFWGTISYANLIGNLCNWEMEFGFHPACPIDAGAELKGQAAYGRALLIGNNDDDDRARGAWEFMKWLLKDENTSDFAIISGNLPVTISGFNSDAYQEWSAEYFPTAGWTFEAQVNSQPGSGRAKMPMYGRCNYIIANTIGMFLWHASNNTYLNPVGTVENLAGEINRCIEEYHWARA